MDQLSSEVVAMMQEAVKHASTGKGDPEILRRIHEEAVKIRAEVLKKHGVLDIASPRHFPGVGEVVNESN